MSNRGSGSRRPARLVAGLVAVAALLVLCAPWSNTAARALDTAAPSGGSLPGSGPPPGSTTVPDGTNGKIAGMAIPNVSEQQSPDEVARLRSDGLNTISLFVWWVMAKQDSNTLEPDYKDGITETDQNLEVQIAASVRAGMRVILVPIFYCESCDGGWRGTIAPSDPAAWFDSYRSFIDHYADISQQYQVNTLFIGSEMSSMEADTSGWRAVIADTRSHFSGQIGYEENWDVIGNAKFVSDLDLLGVSAYFPLDSGKSPALADLLSDWSSSHSSQYGGRNWLAALSHLAATANKPILFGESGYMSGDYAGNQPFLNYLSTTNWQLQSDLYQALLETFSTRSWWAGVVWWEWYLGNDTTKDNSRTPRGKTAEELLTRWYRQGLRPPSPQTPLALSSSAYSPDDAEVPRYSPAGAAGPGGSGQATGVGAGATRASGQASASTGGPGLGSSAGVGRPGSSGGNQTRATPTAAPGGLAGATPGPARPGLSSGRKALAGLAVLVLIAVLGGLAGATGARAHPLRR